MLDERLRCAASLIRRGSRVADIGTDHAYLPIQLIREGICPSAIASDVRPGPAGTARRNVQAAGLDGVIQVRLGDGLSPLSPGEADDIVIAGMGGETIAAILQAAGWVKDGRYRLVLQPMTRPEKLRQYLLTGGFSLLREAVVRAGGHLYVVMSAGYTGAPPVTDEAAYYRGALGKDGAAFLQKEIDRLRRQEAGWQSAGREQQAARLHQLIARLEESL